MLYIRTDMNDTIATGHVMRCLAIADAAGKQGETTVFLLADGSASAFLAERGYESITLDTQWNDMEGELETLFSLIRKRKIKKLLIDSYQVTESYLAALRRAVKTVYLDDLNAFVYSVDMLVCYAVYWEKFGYEKAYRETKLLLGTAYTPLREAFFSCRKKEIGDRIEHILLLSGGTDPYDTIKSLLEQLPRDSYRCITVLCGRYYAGYEELKKTYPEGKNVAIYQAVPDIERYMAEADVAITAGGTTLYELCAVGTPSISYSFADNQLENVLQFQKDGLIDYAGDARKENVAECVVELLKTYSRKKRVLRSEAMQRLVDGRGAARIAEAWIKL